jgi:hypothetical protein
MLLFREMVEHFRGQSRGIFAFVGQKQKPHEMYLLPPCQLASMVLASAKQAAGPHMEARIPAAVSGDQLLAVIIYRKVRVSKMYCLVWHVWVGFWVWRKGVCTCMLSCLAPCNCRHIKAPTPAQPTFCCTCTPFLILVCVVAVVHPSTANHFW